MKRLKHLYSIPFLVALGVAVILIKQLLPSELFYSAVWVVVIPLIIIAIGFRMITYYRIQTIRNQLLQIFQTLEEFDVDEPTKVIFEQSPYPIFNELNEYLIELINRIRATYQANKQFTQNASHELQTPLAIIKGHIELLLQSPHLGEKEITSLATVLQNTNRLSKINSSLILLSKIEHQRFSDSTKVDFSRIVDEVLQNFKDLIQIQEIDVQKKDNTPFIVEMSETLAEILIANLIQNAIRHNIEQDGFIQIEMDSNHLKIKNSGKSITAKPKELFKRFKRESEVTESLGLGLSIVQRICEQSNLHIQYVIEDQLHNLVIQQV